MLSNRFHMLDNVYNVNFIFLKQTYVTYVNIHNHCVHIRMYDKRINTRNSLDTHNAQYVLYQSEDILYPCVFATDAKTYCKKARVDKT